MTTTDHVAPSFRIRGLAAAPFRHLFSLSDDALAANGARRYVADEKPGFPDRVELRDAEVGESVILVNYRHLPEPGPYQGSHAVFVVEGAGETFDAVDRVPDVLRSRMLSLRGFDRDGMMVDADLVAGRDIEALIASFFAQPEIEFIHVHYAKRGCFACRIDRASKGAAQRFEIASEAAVVPA